LLHIVSAEGAPSVGVYVRLVAPPACVYPVDLESGVFIEAEGSSRHAGPFLRVDEAGRGNDAFVRVDPAADSLVDVPDEGNVMWYDLDVAKGGTAYLWALGNGPATTSDTLFVSVNGGADQIVTLTPAAWGWTRAKTALNLPTGKQTLKIKAAKAGAQLDRIWLTSDDAAPAPADLGAAAPDTPCSKGQVFEPPNGGSGGTGGSGGAATAAGASGGGVPAGGGASATGGSPTAGVNSGGMTAKTAPPKEEGCGCRTVSSSEPGPEMLGLFGMLSALWVAAARRPSRIGSRRFRGAGLP
jgi:MYXO-CTERM domain-containing protein